MSEYMPSMLGLWCCGGAPVHNCVHVEHDSGKAAYIGTMFDGVTAHIET